MTAIRPCFANSLIMAMLGGVMGILAPALTYAVHPVETGLMSPDIRIASTEFSFTPNRVKLAAGKAFHLILDNNRGETEHVITIPALGKRIMASSGAEGSDLVVFDKPGEYEFVCDLPGHTEGGMKGSFLVMPTADSESTPPAIRQEYSLK